MKIETRGNAKDLKSKNPIVCPGQVIGESDTGYLKWNPSKDTSIKYNDLKYIHEFFPFGNSGIDPSNFVSLNVFNQTISQLNSRIDQINNNPLSLAFNSNRPINRVPEIGDNIGGSTIEEFLEFYYPPAPLTVDLDGEYNGINFESSIILEMMQTGGNIAVDTNWSVARDISSAEIGSILVEGQNQNFNQPNPGASAVGTETISISRNNNTTITLIATDVNNEVYTSNISIKFEWKRYWGFVTSFNPSTAASEIINKNGELSNTASKSSFNINHPDNSTKLYPCIAINKDVLDAASLAIIIGGLDNTGVFNIYDVQLTNSEGATDTYVIAIGQNDITTDLENVEIKAL